MKIRNGFVSNSSSSSFICDVCNEEFSGMDLSLTDCDCSECVGGHTFCNDHAERDLSPESFNKEDFIKYFLDEKDEDYEMVKNFNDDEFEEWFEEGEWEWELPYQIPSEFCPICSMKEFTNEMLVDYIAKITKFTKADMFKIIKEKNKRRKKLYLNEYLNHVDEQNIAKILEVKKDLQDNFKTYDEMYQFIYG